MEYGLLGRTLKHSFSKTIHEMLAPYSYELKELEPDKIGEFLLAKNFRALNVTIPYKQTVIPYLDEIDESALSIGAVNTIVNDNGKLFGYNTDYFGMRDLILKIGVDLTDKKALILGTGGTSKTAEAVLTSLGAKEIIKVSRREGLGAVSYENAIKYHGNANFIVNTTPLGMYPDVKGVAIDLGKFTNLEGVADAVYNPLRSQLILDAQSLGIKAEGGLYMLVAQAVYASEKFHSTKYKDGTVDEIFAKVRKQKRNIVLVGMPASGKSTIGKKLTEYGYEFVDTDLLIEEKLGKKCGEIILENGIEFFRKVESEVINGLVFCNGKVIATGGGAVLNNDNVTTLKRNGYIYYLNANLDRLTATDDRPLSNNKEKLIALYNERKDIYLSCADVVINDDTIENEIAQILTGEEK